MQSIIWPFQEQIPDRIHPEVTGIDREIQYVEYCDQVITDLWALLEWEGYDVKNSVVYWVVADALHFKIRCKSGDGVHHYLFHIWLLYHSQIRQRCPSAIALYTFLSLASLFQEPLDKFLGSMGKNKCRLSFGII